MTAFVIWWLFPTPTKAAERINILKTPCPLAIHGQRQQCSEDHRTKYPAQQQHILFPRVPQSQAKLGHSESAGDTVSVGVWGWSTRDRRRQMSFSLSWLSLTSVTKVASVELLLIYIGLPSETHPVKCLDCIQAASGKVSLSGGKLKMVLQIVPFFSTRPSSLWPQRTEKPQGAPSICTGSPLPTQPSGSQGMAAVEVEWACFHSSAFPSLGYRSGMLEVLNNGGKFLCVHISSATQAASFMDISHFTVCCRL